MVPDVCWNVLVYKISQVNRWRILSPPIKKTCQNLLCVAVLHLLLTTHIENDKQTPMY